MDQFEQHKRAPYTYQSHSVEHKQLRLLKVLAGEKADSLQCSIVHASLLDEPRPVYETISYVWGNSLRSSSIYVDGSLISIPDSSDRVIRRMRYPDRDRVLWLDAVCINQDDPEE